MYEYDLFAVINHEGQINNGHYTNFARFQDEVSMIYWMVLMTPSDLINYFCPSVVSIWWRQVWFFGVWSDLQIFSNLSSFRVTSSSLGACLNSAAYMCFYVKRHLDYKPNITPSYVLTRENEAMREKELEKEKEAARMKELEDDLLSTLWTLLSHTFLVIMTCALGWLAHIIISVNGTLFINCKRRFWFMRQH